VTFRYLPRGTIAPIGVVVALSTFDCPGARSYEKGISMRQSSFITRVVESKPASS
jgi:hypothetical protein